ncbi:MAG TPA: hypothetical protein VJV39_12735 [Dongiaceae bacterium]|nr:hypothetical protein [Dongiaceae bacterium]
MGEAMQYRLSSSPNVSARSFGDEVVAANFVKGVYYSLLGPAAQIWDGLIAGVAIETVIAQTAALSDADAADFAAAANNLVQALLDEQLIEPAPDAAATAWQPVPGADGPYGLPVIERFTDMEDLLQLDPVHDVEEMGWPHVNPASTR